MDKVQKGGLVQGPVGWTLELSRGRDEMKDWPATVGPGHSPEEHSLPAL